MTFVKKMTLTFSFVAATVLAGSAQEITAKFTLQHPTSFGSKILPAGDYRMQTLNQGTLLALITSMDSQKESVVLVPKSREYTAACTRSSLQTIAKNGQWTATSICLADTGLTLYFSEPAMKQPVSSAALAGTY